MSREREFEGFPKAGLTFLRSLAKNNDRGWFEAHKKEHEETILAPSKAFVTVMGERLREISRGIRAEPKVNGSLFRLNRDTRFSADKAPYKTNVGIFFWEGRRKRMECPGFYLHLEASSLMLGVGMYMFPKELIGVYRDAAVDRKLGPALREAIDAVGAERFGQAGCGMPIERYKKVPPGYDASHPNAELLKLKGLHAGVEEKIPAVLHTPAFVDYAFERWSRLAPIHHWLVKALARA